MEIAYDRVGDGPALVLIHPLGADRHVWDPVIGALATRREVIALDLPGFGESPPLTGVTPTPRALADAVEALLDRLQLDRPQIAGNSLGGWVALEIGLSGAAGSVTAIAPAGLWPEPLVPKAALAHRLARATLPLSTMLPRLGPARALLLNGAAAHPRRIPAAEASHLVAAYARAPGFTAVNDAMRAGRFGALERVRCPVTLAWPDHDRLIERPLWIPERVHNVVLHDAGHIPMWDVPGQIVELLLTTSARTSAVH